MVKFLNELPQAPAGPTTLTFPNKGQSYLSTYVHNEELLWKPKPEFVMHVADLLTNKDMKDLVEWNTKTQKAMEKGLKRKFLKWNDLVVSRISKEGKPYTIVKFKTDNEETPVTSTNDFNTVKKTFDELKDILSFAEKDVKHNNIVNFKPKVWVQETEDGALKGGVNLYITSVISEYF